MCITKDILYCGMKQWVESARNGDTISHEEADAMSIKENAQAATDGFWEWLEQDTKKFDK